MKVLELLKSIEVITKKIAPMNIFILDNDIQKSVQYHFDKHVVKMPTEAAQILSCVIWKLDEKLASSLYREGKLYAFDSKHINNPLVDWCISNKHHFEYTMQYLDFLSEEYSFRYNKRHAALKHWNTFAEFLVQHFHSRYTLLSIGNISHIHCMPDKYSLPLTVPNATVRSYRRYYYYKKLYLYGYKKRPAPDWLKELTLNEKLSKLGE